MELTKETRDYKFVGAPASVMEWLNERFGIDPTMTSRVEIVIDASCAAQVTIHGFVRESDLEAMPEVEAADE